MALFGIKRIQYCKATQLAFSGQNNPFLGIASEPTNTFTDVVCMINSRATLTIEQAVVNKQIVYTAKLQFVTPTDPMLDVDHYAFIATTNEGERILLGANTRPQVAVVTAQGVFGNAGELTAYTTTAEFKADYRPLRLPVTAAEPISGPAYDICCGQIPQPTAPDARQFDICCGQIKTSEPISGPAYDVCCGEIVGSGPEPTLLTVMWLNYDLSVVDSKTYYEGQPEPTTTAVPVRPSTSTTAYTFSGWELYGQTETRKVYMAQYTETPIYHDLNCDIVATGSVYEDNRYLHDTAYNGQQYSGDGELPVILVEGGEPVYMGDAWAFKQTANFQLVSTDWHDYFTRFTDRTPIYDANNPSLIIGYKLNSYSGPLPPWS